MDVDIQRRALSYVGRDELDTSRAEFYTAVGPDGKEVILRKYLKDQAVFSETQDNDMRIGFVSQALGHLQQEYENEKLKANTQIQSFFISSSVKLYSEIDQTDHQWNIENLIHIIMKDMIIIKEGKDMKVHIMAKRMRENISYKNLPKMITRIQDMNHMILMKIF